MKLLQIILVRTTPKKVKMPQHKAQIKIIVKTLYHSFKCCAKIRTVLSPNLTNLWPNLPLFFARCGVRALLVTESLLQKIQNE